MRKPSILIARAIHPEVVAFLQQHFEVQANQDDTVWSPQELVQQLQGKDGVLTTGSQSIDGALLAACPQLKAVANMAVGYNNFDVPALTAAGVQATNAPDVLTETTADFGFALLMATARRVTESEHYLREACGKSGATICLRALKCMAVRWALLVWAALVRALPSVGHTVLA